MNPLKWLTRLPMRRFLRDRIAVALDAENAHIQRAAIRADKAAFDAAFGFARCPRCRSVWDGNADRVVTYPCDEHAADYGDLPGGRHRRVQSTGHDVVIASVTDLADRRGSR